jgi:hypothetical protein
MCSNISLPRGGRTKYCLAPQKAWPQCIFACAYRALSTIPLELQICQKLVAANMSTGMKNITFLNHNGASIYRLALQVMRSQWLFQTHAQSYHQCRMGGWNTQCKHMHLFHDRAVRPSPLKRSSLLFDHSHGGLLLFQPEVKVQQEHTNESLVAILSSHSQKTAKKIVNSEKDQH